MILGSTGVSGTAIYRSARGLSGFLKTDIGCATSRKSGSRGTDSDRPYHQDHRNDSQTVGYQMTTEKILVTATEAAAMLSIGRSTFFRNVTLGLLPKPVRMLGTIRWRVEDLRAVGQANQPTTASSPDAAAGTAPGCTQPAPRQPPCARAGAR